MFLPVGGDVLTSSETAGFSRHKNSWKRQKWYLKTSSGETQTAVGHRERKKSDYKLLCECAMTHLLHLSALDVSVVLLLVTGFVDVAAS